MGKETVGIVHGQPGCFQRKYGLEMISNIVCVISMGNWSRAVYHMKMSGLRQFVVSATRRQSDETVNASLSINVLDQVSGLRLTTRRPYAVLLTDKALSLYTDPVLFTAR